jgi:EAL and modified HD-GYP domain-containing signal transduction protein
MDVNDVLGEVLVARQPIVDRHLEVVGYELLYRGTDGRAPEERDAVRATATVLIDGVLAVGRDILADGEDVYVNVPRALLVAGTVLDVPSEGIVLEVLEDVVDEPAVRQAISAHRAVGFRVALDDVVPGDPRLPLCPLVDIVKVDVVASPLPVTLELIRDLARQGARVVAEKVEDPVVFDRVVAAGAELIQGFFFTRPRAIRAVRPRGLSADHLRLLDAVAVDDIDLDLVERLIRSDLTLTDRFLRLVSLAAGWRQVESVRHGLTMVGQRAVHRWVTLLVMSAVAYDAPAELLITASVRARYCELLEQRRQTGRRLEAFSLGMFSVLGADGVLDRATLADLPLSDDVAAALLGDPGPLRDLLELQFAAERADWEALVALGRRLGLQPRELAAAHIEALRWASGVRAAA